MYRTVSQGQPMRGNRTVGHAVGLAAAPSLARFTVHAMVEVAREYGRIGGSDESGFVGTHGLMVGG